MKTTRRGFFQKLGTCIVAAFSGIEVAKTLQKSNTERAEFVNPLLQAPTLILGHEAGHLTDRQIQEMLPGGTGGITTDELYKMRECFLYRAGDFKTIPL